MAFTHPQTYSLAGNYALDEDIDRGFDTAVKNGQTTMALQYLRLVLARDHEELANLRAQLNELKSTAAAAAEAPPVTRRAAKAKDNADTD